MDINAKVLIMSAVPYDMVSESTGEKVSGCTVQYYFIGEQGEGLASVEDFTGGSIGYQRSKVSLPYEMRNELNVVPALYNGEFSMKVGSDGKPVLTMKDVELICPVDFESMIKPALAKAEKEPKQ